MLNLPNIVKGFSNRRAESLEKIYRQIEADRVKGSSGFITVVRGDTSVSVVQDLRLEGYGVQILNVTQGSDVQVVVTWGPK